MNNKPFKENLIRKTIKELLEKSKEPKFLEVKDELEKKFEKVPEELGTSVSKTWVNQIARKMEKEGKIGLKQTEEEGNLVWRITKPEIFKNS